MRGQPLPEVTPRIAGRCIPRRPAPLSGKPRALQLDAVRAGVVTAYSGDRPERRPHSNHERKDHAKYDLNGSEYENLYDRHQLQHLTVGADLADKSPGRQQPLPGASITRPFSEARRRGSFRAATVPVPVGTERLRSVQQMALRLAGLTTGPCFAKRFIQLPAGGSGWWVWQRRGKQTRTSLTRLTTEAPTCGNTRNLERGARSSRQGRERAFTGFRRQRVSRFDPATTNLAGNQPGLPHHHCSAWGIGCGPSSYRIHIFPSDNGLGRRRCDA